jgi:hypothetical protein
MEANCQVDFVLIVVRETSLPLQQRPSFFQKSRRVYGRPTDDRGMTYFNLFCDRAFAVKI